MSMGSCAKSKALVLAAFAASAACAIAGQAFAAQRPMSELTPVFRLRIGSLATWVVVSPASVWVASEKPNAIHRIDPKTNKQTADIGLPGDPCGGLAVGLGYLWVPLCGPMPSLAKIDLQTNEIASVFPVGPSVPEGGIAVSRDSVWLVTDKNGTLARIDPASGQVRQTVQIPAGSFNPAYSDGQIWVTHSSGSDLTRIDASTGKVTGTIRTGRGPHFITTGGGSVWTLNAGDATVSRIDVRSGELTQTIPLHIVARGGDLQFGEGHVWVTIQKVPLTAIDAKSGILECQWAGVGGDSFAIGHGAIWMSNYQQGILERLNVKDVLSHCAGKPNRSG
jgi:streptogramin lyase